MKCNIIACVLRSGGEYSAADVNKLANAIARHVTVDYKFVVLTDETESTLYNQNVHCITPLKHDYPGWWSKIELHRRDFFPRHPIVFFDLDTIILGNLDHIIAYPHKMTALQDFYYPDRIGSGVLAWTQQPTDFYHEFMLNPQKAMNATTRGDQEWLETTVDTIERFQVLFPGEFVSFKKDCIRSATDITVPSGAKVMCFHGKPKPQDVMQYNIIKENWR